MAPAQVGDIVAGARIGRPADRLRRELAPFVRDQDEIRGDDATNLLDKGRGIAFIDTGIAPAGHERSEDRRRGMAALPREEQSPPSQRVGTAGEKGGHLHAAIQELRIGPGATEVAHGQGLWTLPSLCQEIVDQ